MFTTDLERAAKVLDKDAVLRIRKGRGQSLIVLDGLIWVTQSGDRRDVFLGDGESVALEGSGLTVVQALERTRLLVLAPVLPEPASRAAGRRQHSSSLQGHTP